MPRLFLALQTEPVRQLTDRFTNQIGDWTNLSQNLVDNFLYSLLWIAVLALVRSIALRVVRSRTKDVKVRYQWRKTITYVTVVIGILAVGSVWFDGLRQIGTFLGLLTAGLAIALRDPVVNVAGWIFILWRRPFIVGDRIQLGDNAGDVIDLRIFQFTVLEIGNWVDADQSTGRIIHMPNGLVFNQPLANYTRGMQYIWNEIPVLVTFESNWRKAKEILREVVDEHARGFADEAEKGMLRASRKFMIFYSNLTPTVYTSVMDSGVLLTLRYLCDPRQRRGTAQAMWESILDRFHERDDIDFAYPTRRYYFNPSEGKPGAGGEPPARPTTDDRRPTTGPGGPQDSTAPGDPGAG